jgi:peptidoglycan hydrolase-like protein with peptidoglycan-binding domain
MAQAGLVDIARRLSEVRPDGANLPRRDVGPVVAGLAAVVGGVSPADIGRKALGATAVSALRTLQARAGLPETGEVDAPTLSRLRAEVTDKHVTTSAFRTAKVQEMLVRAGFAPDATELSERRLGDSTRAALRRFQEEAGLAVNGLASDEVRDALATWALTARLSTKTQIAKVQRSLLRAARIRGITLAIDGQEMRARQFGPSTVQAVRVVQRSLHLPETGMIDPATYERLRSVAVSRDTAKAKVGRPDPAALEPVPVTLRLNAANRHVPTLQKALTFLGHPVDEREYKATTFGPSTRAAVIAFQDKAGLPQSGHADGVTLKRINEAISAAKPAVAPSARIRGTVRDATWVGRSGVRVELRTDALRGDSIPLGTRTTLGNGFYDLPYAPPVNPANGEPISPLRLVVTFTDPAGALIGTKRLEDPTTIAWANFTEGDYPYKGPSEFDTRRTQVAAAGGVDPGQLVETTADPEVSRVAQTAGLTQDEVMRLVLADRAATELADPRLDASVCYAFLAQSLPPNLPDDLLASTNEWELIDQLTDRVAAGIAFMDAVLQEHTLDIALTENLVPVSLAQGRAGVTAALTEVRRRFALDKPLLVGNGTLRQLLAGTSVPAAAYPTVADAFVVNGGLGERFWARVREDPGEFGGLDAVADLQTTVDVGLVAKNHRSMVTFLKERIADAADPRITSSRDLAKLTPDNLAALIQENGDAIPANTDGDTVEQRRATYARTMAHQSERLYPTVAFTAEIARSPATRLEQVEQIATIVDAHPDLELRQVNIDAFAEERNINLTEQVRGELLVMQRVHRLAPTASAGRALLDAGLHSSVQLVSLGQAELVNRLTAQGVDERTARTTHGYAEFQYAQVLLRLGEYRTELTRIAPAAIAPQTLTADERAQLLGQLPHLETLFGSLDICDCPQCASVYSPAAYLADILRFLDAHPAATSGGTVRTVLTRRRPELGGIQLTCENTETPVPYIDLVCEVLEAAVPASAGRHDLQTTLPADQLRAVPEHEDAGAYETLRTADVPMSSAFDLWQEQSRTFLAHLGVPRWTLMEALRDPAAGSPSTADVAAEFFGISSHETGLVTNPVADNALNALWGFDTSRSEIGVPEILDAAHLTYPQLLQLLQTLWITPTGAARRVALERPANTCALDAQRVAFLSADSLDRMHRLLRLWHHVPWDLWELDLLVRSGRLGNAAVDGVALNALKGAAQLRERLGAAPEMLATWFGELPTIGHPDAADPADPARRAPSLYANLFQNRAVLDPPDPAFALPLAAGDLSAHRPTLLAALRVTDDELTTLLARVGTTLDLAHLGALVRWSTLAQAMRLRLADLLMLADLAAPVVPDPFASPAELLRLLELYEILRTSSVPLPELDYLLHARPDSPYAAGDDVVTAQAHQLRETLRTSPTGARRGQVAAHLAAVLALPEAQVGLLLAQPSGAGTLADRFTDPELTARTPDGDYVNELTPARFLDLYAAYRLLAKVARVLKATGVEDAGQLGWLLAHGADLDIMSLSGLPVDAEPAAPLFGGWLNLVRWSRLRRALVERSVAAAAASSGGAGGSAAPSVTPEDLVALAADPAATVAQARGLAETLLGIPVADLARLDGGTRAGYTDLDILERLLTAWLHAHRLGVDVATARSWAVREQVGGPSEADIATQVRRAAKAKYDPQAWLSIVTPLQDILRERKRDALVAFLLENSARTAPPTITVDGVVYANPARWHDSDDLLAYLLLDVEMSACQPTSRIKQALGSVQMFVQRAFLNLEKPFVVITSEERADQASLDSWRQWRWMKNYRLWEANRKVFLYPENWIEPELRDDKSPFFVELENELQQAEITADNCETALRHYLEKVHRVANLKVLGVHHEVDDDNPYDALPPTVNVLHVVARTRSDPASYFYRHLDLNTSEWSPWERIELDITGDHVVPVIYNRVLHLFWLEIAEKPQQGSRQPAAAPTAGTKPAPQPPKQLEIKLAWSVRHGGEWAPRQLSPNTLIHPWQRPFSSYTLKPRYKSTENQLWLDLYISMSLEFNNRKFYDPYTGDQNFVTATRFDETARPWHSSSFVFDGQVVAVKLKPLNGQYHVLDGTGVMSENLQDTTSFRYVHDSTGAVSTNLQPLVGGYEIAPRLALPAGMHYEANRLVNNTWAANPGSPAVLEAGQSVTLLEGAPSPFEIVFSQHHIQMDTAGYERGPFIYQDSARAYFVRSDWIQVMVDSTQSVQRLRYSFSPFMHPYTALFLRELNRSGVEGLLNRKIQRFPEQYPPTRIFAFSTAYRPVTGRAVVDPSAEHDIVDFARSSAMGLYNWEIFFHVPFLIGCKLMQNQRFEEAMSWFHRVFDPTNTESLSAPQRFWVTKPFFEQNDEAYRRQRIESLLQNLPQRLDEVRAWKNAPFKPHLIARYRPVAYQKAVVMKYIDNLIAWGDRLFRRDTIESINEATLLYVLAGELLGRRPERVPPLPRPARSYDDLVAELALDPFGNQQVDVLLENLTDRPTLVISADGAGEALPVVSLQYFGVPANTDLLAYWDTVADRLFKIRNCMNIAGTVRTLPLFEPPIDPALLIRAAAAGVDLDSVLSDAAAAASPYRFRTLIAKAVELASDVRALGDRMLMTLERRDAEGLALLLANNDATLQTAMSLSRKKQVEEAERAVEALEKGRDVVQTRIDYYSGLPYMNAFEIAATLLHGLAIPSELMATTLNIVSGVANLVPDFGFGIAGFGGSPTVTLSYGGHNIAGSASSFAAMHQGFAAIMHTSGSLMDAQGTYLRQFQANQFQGSLATAEKAQLEAQILAAQVRQAVAELELTTQETAVANTEAVAAYLQSKYTTQQLYDWMVGQLSTVYFQAYQLAYDMAKRAEAAFRFELTEPATAPIIQFGYWDSLRKGLLAGERLSNDIRRLETAYLERHTRRLECSKHVSLATVMPTNLLELTTRGTTTITLPEWLYDLDHPGLYQRRLRSVAISVPCTTGPYVGIHVQVDLTRAVVRLNDSVAGGYGDALSAGADARFATAMSSVSTIVTSHASVDRGIFETGGDDDRYLPFEGAGAVGQWTLTLDPASNQFDLFSVTDVVLHLEYTALRGGPALVTAARTAAQAAIPSAGARVYALDTDFPQQWHRFPHPDPGTEQVLTFPVAVDDLPYLARVLARTRTLSVVRADLVVESAYAGAFDVRVRTPGQAAPGAVVPMPRDPAFGGLHHAPFAFAAGMRPLLGDWRVQFKRDLDATFDVLPDNLITHAYVLFQFSAT